MSSLPLQVADIEGSDESSVLETFQAVALEVRHLARELKRLRSATEVSYDVEQRLATFCVRAGSAPTALAGVSAGGSLFAQLSMEGESPDEQQGSISSW